MIWCIDIWWWLIFCFMWEWKSKTILWTTKKKPPTFHYTGCSSIDPYNGLWWFQIFLYFQPYLGKWSNLTNIFQMGRNHKLVNNYGPFFHCSFGTSHWTCRVYSHWSQWGSSPWSMRLHPDGWMRADPPPKMKEHPLKRKPFKRKFFIFQASIFRGLTVSFQGIRVLYLKFIPRLSTIILRHSYDIRFWEVPREATLPQCYAMEKMATNWSYTWAKLT